MAAWRTAGLYSSRSGLGGQYLTSPTNSLHPLSSKLFRGFKRPLAVKFVGVKFAYPEPPADLHRMPAWRTAVLYSSRSGTCLYLRFRGPFIIIIMIVSLLLLFILFLLSIRVSASGICVPGSRCLSGICDIYLYFGYLRFRVSGLVFKV